MIAPHFAVLSFQSGIRNLWLMPSLDVSDRNRNLSLKR
jgi:hypothetical protein